MEVSEIVERVKSAIDELVTFEGQGLAVDENGRNLDDVIKDKIPYALNWVLQNAPQDKIDSSMVSSYRGGAVASDTVLKAEKGYNDVVTVSLPDGMLRVLSAKMSSWYYSPTPVSEFSETALMQQGRTTMGCPDKPVTVLCTEGGKSVLKMYTAEPNEDAEDMSIQLIMTPDAQLVSTPDGGDADVNVPMKLKKPFIYYIAYLTLLAMRDGSAASFYQVAASDLGGEDKNQ